MSTEFSKPRCPIAWRKPSGILKKKMKLKYKEMIMRDRKSEKALFDSLPIHDSKFPSRPSPFLPPYWSLVIS